jgi:hypothetical protein
VREINEKDGGDKYRYIVRTFVNVMENWDFRNVIFP